MLKGSSLRKVFLLQLKFHKKQKKKIVGEQLIVLYRLLWDFFPICFALSLTNTKSTLNFNFLVPDEFQQKVENKLLACWIFFRKDTLSSLFDTQPHACLTSHLQMLFCLRPSGHSFLLYSFGIKVSFGWQLQRFQKLFRFVSIVVFLLYMQL